MVLYIYTCNIVQCSNLGDLIYAIQCLSFGYGKNNLNSLFYFFFFFSEKNLVYSLNAQSWPHGQSREPGTQTMSPAHCLSHHCHLQGLCQEAGYRNQVELQTQALGYRMAGMLIKKMNLMHMFHLSVTLNFSFLETKGSLRCCKYFMC